MQKPLIRVTQLTEFASRRAAGLFESVRGLSSALQSNGLADVRVVARRDEFSDLDRLVWGGVDLVHVEIRNRLRVVTGRDMSDECLRAPFDVLHVHGLWGCSERAAVDLLRRKGRIAYVVSPRGTLSPWALGYKRWKKKLSWMVWERQLLSNAACLHALNENEAEMILKFGFGRPVCVVPNGIDLPVNVGPRRKRRRRLLYLGRLHPIKGLSELISGWSKVAPALRAEWELQLAGWDDSGEESNYRALAARLAPDSITFPGRAFGVKKDQLFREADAFILPSHSEGLPTAVLEAWSYALPVAMTEACNLSMGFEHGAAIRIAPDPDQIAVALTQLLAQSDEELEKMGAAGRRLAEGSFSWKRVASDMSSVYQWICGGERPSSVILP